jgi:hypothetical protein
MADSLCLTSISSGAERRNLPQNGSTHPVARKLIYCFVLIHPGSDAVKVSTLVSRVQVRRVSKWGLRIYVEKHRCNISDAHNKHTEDFNAMICTTCMVSNFCP